MTVQDLENRLRENALGFEITKWDIPEMNPKKGFYLGFHTDGKQQFILAIRQLPEMIHISCHTGDGCGACFQFNIMDDSDYDFLMAMIKNIDKFIR